MINSNQVNALMMQQQQQQQMLGMGAPSAVLGQSQYPPQFNFSNSGNALSSGGGPVSMAASGVAGLGSALGIGSMAAGFAPASIAGSMGSGFVGGALGFAGLNPLTLGLMGAAAGVGAVGSSMNNGIQMNTRVGQMLSAANFANPNAPGGFGFGFADQSRMTNTILGMGSSNAFVGQQDQMQLLNQFQQMGLDKGVTSMGKMIDKFKEFSKTTEEVATQLGKTVTEVTGLVQNLRGSGFYSAGEITGMSSRMSASASYGINMQQQQQMMQSMSGQARAAGLTGASGAMMGVNLAQAFGSANQMGFINENTLLDITGTNNTADASQAMAQSLGGRFSAAMTQGGMLENMLAGFAKVGPDGRLSIDQDTMSRVAGGDMSFDALRGRASSMLGGENRAKFSTSRRRLASEFLQSDSGMGAILGTFKGMATQRAAGGDVTEEEAFKLLMKEYNIADERQSQLLFEMSSNMDDLLSNNLKNRANTLASEKRRAYIAKHRSFEGLKTKMSAEVGKLTNNATLGAATARAGTAFDAGMDSVERYMFGIEQSTAGLYTAANTTSFRDDFLSGNLDSFGLSASGDGNRGRLGNQLATSATQAAQLYSLSDDAFTAGGRSRFMDKLSSGIDTAALGSISLKGAMTSGGGLSRMISSGTGLGDDALGAFNYETAYSGPDGRDADFFMRNRVFGMFGKEDEGIYRDLMLNARVKASEVLKKPMNEVTDQEAQFIIANQGGKSAAALQRYMSRHKEGAVSLSNDIEGEFLASASGGNIGIMGHMAVGAATLGIGVGVASAGVFSVPAAIVGAAGGLVTGLMEEGNRAEFEAQMKGGSGALLGRLNSKGKLQSFDKKMQEAMLDNPGDREAALQQVAEEMSASGEKVTSEDVRGALHALYRSSGHKSFDDRLASGDYTKGLKLTDLASKYTKREMAKGHLQTLRDSLLGEDVEGIEGLQDALSSGGDEIIGRSREELLNLARKAATGEFEYSGDNAVLQQIASAGDLNKDLQSLAGQNVSALDKKFGQGAGQALRKLAGKRVHGELTPKELKEMAAKLAVSDSLKVAEGGAKTGATSVEGTGDNEILTATSELVNSTQKLAVYVDNIASVLTGNETAGKKIPGIRAVDKED